MKSKIWKKNNLYIYPPRPLKIMPRTSPVKNAKRKRKAATNAIREIRAEQKNTRLIIPVAPFNRVVAGVASNFKHGLRFKSSAYTALHAASEEFLIDVFQNANKCAIHDNRETVQSKDLHLARELMTNE